MNDGQLIQRLRDLDQPVEPETAFADVLFATLRREAGRRPISPPTIGRTLAFAGAAAAVVIAAVLVVGLLAGTHPGPAGTPPVPIASPSIEPLASPTVSATGEGSWRQGAPPPSAGDDAPNPFRVPTLIGWRDGEVWAFIVPPEPNAQSNLMTYDVAADEWTDLGEVSFGGSLSDLAPTAAALHPNGDILVFGHVDSERGVWRIDAESLEASGPTPDGPDLRAGGFTVARTGQDGRIYLLETAGPPLRSPVSLVIYDPMLDEWTEAPPIPTRRIRPQLAVDPTGVAYVIGGAGQSGPVGVVESFDPATGEWADEPGLPDAVAGTRWGHAATWGPHDALNVYWYGGRAPMSIYRRVRPAGRWETLPGPPIEPHNAVIAPDGTVVVVGHAHDIEISGEQPLDEPVTWIWDVEE